MLQGDVLSIDAHLALFVNIHPQKRDQFLLLQLYEIILLSCRDLILHNSRDQEFFSKFPPFLQKVNKLNIPDIINTNKSSNPTFINKKNKIN